MGHSFADGAAFAMISAVMAVSFALATSAVCLRAAASARFAAPVSLYPLTLYTTPVVYLYLDRLQNWLRGDRSQPGDVTELRDVAAAE
jgi:hypothetical protein